MACKASRLQFLIVLTYIHTQFTHRYTIFIVCNVLCIIKLADYLRSILRVWLQCLWHFSDVVGRFALPTYLRNLVNQRKDNMKRDWTQACRVQFNDWATNDLINCNAEVITTFTIITFKTVDSSKDLVSRYNHFVLNLLSSYHFPHFSCQTCLLDNGQRNWRSLSWWLSHSLYGMQRSVYSGLFMRKAYAEVDHIE